MTRDCLGDNENGTQFESGRSMCEARFIEVPHELPARTGNRSGRSIARNAVRTTGRAVRLAVTAAAESTDDHSCALGDRSVPASNALGIGDIASRERKGHCACCSNSLTSKTQSQFLLNLAHSAPVRASSRSDCILPVTHTLTQHTRH